MRTSSVSEFAKSNNFTQVIPTVRANANNLLYITFIKDDNTAENIYFSKNAAAALTAGIKLNSLKGYTIGYTTNAAGEERIKLISNSERVSIDSMLD